MQLRLISALLACFFFSTCVPLTVAAQADSGQIVITITDSSTAKVPVPLARVLLDGPVMTSEYSGNNGAVKFTDVPDGIYRARIFKGGYQSVTSEQFEVSKGRVVSVAIVLAASQNLKEIGSVTVHSSATVSTSSVTDASTQRKLSGNLADALNKLSGVSVDTSSSEGDTTQTVSLQGQDASQTSLTLDGVPLNAPGSAGNLGSLSTDLFRGASVSNGPQAGALAGGVNFRTLEPTLAWQGTSTISAGSYGKYNWSFGGSGSVGKLGVAVQHAARTTPSLANAMTFSDASGLRYEHDALNQNTGDLLKLRLNAGSAQTLTGTYVDTNVANDLICLEVTGALPCGYGPGNTSSSHFQLMSLTDSALIGQTALQAAIFHTSLTSDRDLLKRLRAGIADPTGSLTDTSNRGISLSALLPARERHTISIAALVNSSSTTVTPFVRRTSLYNTGSRESNYSSLTVTDSIQSSTKLKLSERIGISQASNAHASLLGGVTASWTPTQTDLYTASYSLGGAPGHAGPPGNFSDPSSLRFDCDGNIAYGTAPGDIPGTSSSTDARLNWQHRLKRGVVTTSVYRQVQSGVVLPTQVNGTAINAFPSGYLGAVQDAYDSPGGCNRPGMAFGAQNIYFNVPVGGVRRVYQGASVAATFAVGNFNFQPYYDITQAQIFSSDPRINNPYSIVSSGKQLPNTPLHKAGLTVDYKAPNSHVETLFTAQYVGANNGQNLPAYTLVDAGVEAQLERGSLVFAANNIFNTQSGIFATNAGAVPYTTANGLSIPTIARPNTPREFQITYTVPFGSGATNAARLLPAPRGPGRRFALAELPAAPPPDPFTVTASDACSSKAQQDAAPVVAQLKQYIATIEAAKTATGYPDAVPGAPDIAGVRVIYHKVGLSYALSLEPASASTRGLVIAPACFAIHGAQAQDALQRGLYVPPATVFARPALQFMPAVGFYIVRATPQAGQQSFRLYKLPAQAPVAPFVLQTAQACTSAMKPVAQSLLGELQGYFASGRPLKSWKVVAHSAAGGPWYELASDDFASLPALLNCGHISAASSEEIKAAGFDGVRPPTLNYAPKLGLYIVRGNQADRGAPRPPGP